MQIWDRPWFFAAIAVMGCAAPRIEVFSASPRRICPGSNSVMLTWLVDGSAHLSASPAIDSLGPVASSGRRNVPAQDATITLTASRLLAKSVSSQQVLKFLQEGEVATFGPETRDLTCDEVRREVVATIVFEPEEYDGRVLVRHLENGWDRELAIWHRGRAWTLEKGGGLDLVPLPELAPADPGVLTGGTWVVRARLLEDEHCGDRSASRLLHILLSARLGC
jgi:hypothetical protein